MTRVLVRGSFTREFLGFRPTGKVVELRGMAVHRIADGRLAEHWAQVDMLAFTQQLGPDAALG
jgi:predicted ester cyclase